MLEDEYSNPRGPCEGQSQLRFQLVRLCQRAGPAVCYRSGGYWAVLDVGSVRGEPLQAAPIPTSRPLRRPVVRPASPRPPAAAWPACSPERTAVLVSPPEAVAAARPAKVGKIVIYLTTQD